MRARLVEVKVRDLPTPALVVDGAGLDRNLAAMAAALPGARCRPHVKAHKCTALALRQRAAGHPGFTCATPREVIGIAAAGLGDDLLLANEVVDPDRLAALAAIDARVTVAVDSADTISAAARAGIRECLVDVNVGMPRCGCDPADAGRLAEQARTGGLEVRGVMGYEGHVVGVVDHDERVRQTSVAMEKLALARDAVGGEVVSAGGTGTYAVNELATEIQAGSYALMDTAYASERDLPFRPTLSIIATVISVNAHDGFAVADCGLKALGMDHGGPEVLGHTLWFCSDEHVTFSPDDGAALPTVGERVCVRPAHVDPTVAYHEVLHIADGDGLDADVVETWSVDLRGW
jgi:D-serine deaminase-like pyridoxal phosphate-dependent protein